MQDSETLAPSAAKGDRDSIINPSSDAHPGEETPEELSWGGELRATLLLSWPLVLTQVAQFSYNTTDVIMMGWLGKDHLAAGSLATALFHPILLFGIGALTAVAPMAAQAIGAKDYASMRRTTRQGLWLAGILGLLLIALLYQSGTIYALIGQDPETYILSVGYLKYAAWGLLPALAMVALRGMVNAHSETAIILWITISGIFINAFGNYVLMFGNFGFPRLELEGAGIATSIVNLIGFLMLLVYVLVHKTYRSYEIFARFWKPDWPRFREMLRVGLPIGLMICSEVGMFSAATSMMGWLGRDALAAHAIALQCAGVAFMVPLGLSQAATIRAGLARGRESVVGMMRSGWIAIGLGTGFMVFTGALFLLIPNVLIGFFLDPSDPQNMIPFSLAVSYLAVAALFQLVDGAQAMSAGVLRGLGDTTVPMVVAVFGYWLCGLTTGYVLGFVLDWQGIGIWIGLATGLAVVAVILTIRFAMREKLGLTHGKMTA
ncbi:MAG: MATE family efflux transporter [Cohaesibacter sp.]|nr:MATE family efflux transporter [Cohaesibacter sp.]